MKNKGFTLIELLAVIVILAIIALIATPIVLGIIEDVKFMTYGCASAIATSSISTEMIKGKPIETAINLKNKDVVELLGGLPTHKIHCSVLAEQAIKAALSDYYTRQGIDPEPIVGKICADCEHCESCH